MEFFVVANKDLQLVPLATGRPWSGAFGVNSHNLLLAAVETAIQYQG